MLIIFGFLWWSSSWQWQPHIAGCKFCWPLLRTGLTVLVQFFCKMYFLYVSRSRKKNLWPHDTYKKYILQKKWVKKAIPALGSGQSNLHQPIWGCHRQLDDHHSNPNNNDRDHLVGQLTNDDHVKVDHDDDGLIIDQWARGYETPDRC